MYENWSLVVYRVMVIILLLVVIGKVDYVQAGVPKDEPYNPFLAEPCTPLMVYINLPRQDGGEIHGYVNICMLFTTEPERKSE